MELSARPGCAGRFVLMAHARQFELRSEKREVRKRDGGQAVPYPAVLVPGSLRAAWHGKCWFIQMRHSACRFPARIAGQRRKGGA